VGIVWPTLTFFRYGHCFSFSFYYLTVILLYLYQCYRFYGTPNHNLRYTTINFWCTGMLSDIIPSNTPGLSTPERTVIYTWLFPWEQISPNKIPFMFLFLFHHGILPVPINNYSNVNKVTKWWTQGLCKNLIIKVLYHWASPYTRNWYFNYDIS
jgi:hypothetical protein